MPLQAMPLQALALAEQICLCRHLLLPSRYAFAGTCSCEHCSYEQICLCKHLLLRALLLRTEKIANYAKLLINT